MVKNTILAIKYYRNNIFGNLQYTDDSVINPDRKQFLKAFREFKKSSVHAIDYCTGNVQYCAEYENYSEHENGIVTLTTRTYADIMENNLATTEKMSVEKVKAVFLKAIAENETENDGENEVA